MSSEHSPPLVSVCQVTTLGMVLLYLDRGPACYPLFANAPHLQMRGLFRLPFANGRLLAYSRDAVFAYAAQVQTRSISLLFENATWRQAERRNVRVEAAPICKWEKWETSHLQMGRSARRPICKWGIYTRSSCLQTGVLKRGQKRDARDTSCLQTGRFPFANRT